MAESTLAPGAWVARYEIVRLVGQGGMGAVYEARDPDLARAVALKLIHEPDAHRSMRMLREAQALAQLQHPNVVAVYEVGTAEDRVYIAMELVDGDSLDRAGQRPWPEVVALGVQAGRGLAAAHAKDLVHRDVKPSNILVGADGRVRIGDFGLARLGEAGEPSRDQAAETAAASRATAVTVDESASAAGDDAIAPVSGGGLLASSLTGAGAYLGTPRYMAPEQHLRRAATAKSDQFSFCVAMWELIFDQHPFVEDPDGGWADSVVADRRRPRPAGAPGWLVRALDRGLARDPEARWPSMTALCDQLERAPRRRRGLAVAAAGSLALGGALVAAWQLSSRGPAPVRCDRAGDAVAEVWSAPRRQALIAGFTAVTPFGADAATRTAALVDTWAARWRDTRIAACRATHDRGEQSAVVLDRRMACLDRELALAGTVLERLAAGGPRAVAGAIDAIRTLPEPESCNAARLQAAVPLPTDPRVGAIDADLAAMRAANAVGDLAEAKRRVLSARAAAEALGHPGLRAAVLLDYAAFANATPKEEQAAREGALAAAVEAGDRDLEAAAQLRLLNAASVRGDAKALEVLLPIARAAVARDGVPPALRRDFLQYEATALIRLGKYEDGLAACDRLAAVETAPQPLATRCRCIVHNDAQRYRAAESDCRAAVTAAEAAYGPSHPMVASRLSNLSIALGRLGKNDDAIALDARALALNQAGFGPDSVDVALALVNGATTLIAAGRLDEARANVERALAIHARLAGDDPPGRMQGHAEQKLGEILARQGHHEEGLAHADRAMEILERALPPDHPDLIKLYAQHGNTNLAAERWPVVERSMSRCAELALRVHGEVHPMRALCLLGVAQVQLASGNPGLAAGNASRALAVLTSLGASPMNLAACHGVLGRALGEDGDKQSARAELDRAIAIYQSLGPGGAEGLAEARRQRRRF